jgi:hypothetical protein
MSIATFALERIEDETGISGTGVVAWGCVFAFCGKVALCWTTDVSSVAVYDSLEAVCKIHGHGGKTRLRFVDSEEYQCRADKALGV